MFTGIIYSYRNKLNNKKYIGQTTRPKQRKWEHHCHAFTRGSNKHFYNAIKKYGWEMFEYTVLEEYNFESFEELKAKLNEREMFFINEYHTMDKKYGYNISIGGSHRGNHATKIDLLDLNKNLIKTFDNYIEICSFLKVGSTTIYHHIRNNSICKGQYLITWHGIPSKHTLEEEYSKSHYIYIQKTLQNKVIKKWPSVILIQKELGFDPSSIIKCCLGKLKTTKGFLWERIPK